MWAADSSFKSESRLPAGTTNSVPFICMLGSAELQTGQSSLCDRNYYGYTFVFLLRPSATSILPLLRKDWLHEPNRYLFGKIYSDKKRIVRILRLLRSVFFHKDKIRDMSFSLHIPVDRIHNLPETVQARLKILNDLIGQNIRIWQVVQISQALIFQPEDIEVGFVPCQYFFIAEFSPAAFGIRFAPCFLAFMAIPGLYSCTNSARSSVVICFFRVW